MNPSINRRRELPASPPWIRFHFDGQGRVFARLPSEHLRRETHLDAQAIARALHLPLSAEMADLLDVALAVYAADRLVRRPTSIRGSLLEPQRRLHLEVPVRNLGRWDRQHVHHRLVDYLRALTVDDWRFDFVQAFSALRGSEAQGNLFSGQLDTGARVVLFSGGLDSFAGVVADLEAGPGDRVCLIAGGTNFPMQKRIEDLACHLRGRFGERLLPVLIPIGIRQNDREYDRNEPTQRSRGFLFPALGIVAADLLGEKRVEIYENGIGAINLPISGAQLGAERSRNVNPVTLRLLEEFLGTLFGRSFTFELSRIFSTKADLCSAIRESPHAWLVRHTVSCDGFPQRIAGSEQCGVCTSCVLRRQALRASGLSRLDPGDDYRYDIFGGADAVPRIKRLDLQDMWRQSRLIERACRSAAPWTELREAFPELDEVAEALSPGGTNERRAVEENLVKLYGRYWQEWDRFPVELKAEESAPVK